MLAVLDRWLPTKDRSIVIWATAWFFCLLLGYYHLRPLREAKGFASGSDEIPVLFLCSFLVMLVAVPIYGWVVNRGRGMPLVARVYGFFTLNLILFCAAFYFLKADAAVWVGRVYYVWLSVFNLFVVSLMWSVLAAALTDTQAKRYFGWVAAGGTLGGIVGSTLAEYAIKLVDTWAIPLIAASFLVACGFCCDQFLRAIDRAGVQRMKRTVEDEEAAPVKASIWAGVLVVFRSPYLLGVFVFLLSIQMCGTAVYCQEGDYIRAAGLNEADRFELMASINRWVLASTLLIQLTGTRLLVEKLGLALVLIIFPALYVLGFTMLAVQPSLKLIIILEIVNRAASYAVIVPAIQMLYTVIDKQTLYKAKSFLDTAVVRGGDLLSAQAFGLLKSLGQSLPWIAGLFIPVAILACGVGGWVGRRQRRLATESLPIRQSHTDNV